MTADLDIPHAREDRLRKLVKAVNHLEAPVAGKAGVGGVHSRHGKEDAVDPDLRLVVPQRVVNEDKELVAVRVSPPAERLRNVQDVVDLDGAVGLADDHVFLHRRLLLLRLLLLSLR